jgi:DNA-binding NtrC family response regulator
MITPETFGAAELELVRTKVRAVTRGSERKSRPLPNDAAEEVESRVLLAIAEELAKAPMDVDRLGARAHIHTKRALAALREEVATEDELSPAPPKRDAAEERLLRLGEALRETDGNVSRAARVVGIAPRTMRQAVFDSPALAAIVERARREAA